MILVDTGVFYALFDESDIHHSDSLAILTHILEGKHGRPYTSDYVVLEATTLLRVRAGAKVAQALLNFLERAGIMVIILAEETYRNSVRLFEKQAERLSLCDAATLTLMQALDIEKLATFDERSFRGLVKILLGKCYFESLTEDERRRVRKLHTTLTTK